MALHDSGPIAVRYPRGSGVGLALPEKPQRLEIGKGRIVREGKKIALLSLGTRLGEAEAAAAKLDAMEVFLWMERWTEGDRAKRMKLDAGPWTREKVLRKGSKHVLWLVFALWTGFTFVGFFTPIVEDRKSTRL